MTSDFIDEQATEKPSSLQSTVDVSDPCLYPHTLSCPPYRVPAHSMDCSPVMVRPVTVSHTFL